MTNETEMNELRSRMAVVELAGRQSVEIERLRKRVDELLRSNTEKLNAERLARRKLKVAMSYLSELVTRFSSRSYLALIIEKIDRTT